MTGAPVVITGIGLVTSLGINTRQTWEGVLAGRATAGSMPALETAAGPTLTGHQAADLPADYAPDDPREVRYLRWTIEQAMTQSRAAEVAAASPRRCGIVLGTTLHGMRGAGAFLRDGDLKHLRDFLAGSVLQRATAELGFAGEMLTTCSACSSSLGSIALAVSLLRSRQLDLVISGGYDVISEYAVGGFSSLRLVAAGPLRPFARDREGMKLGEGYGIVVLERAEDAERRGATALAQVLGCGESSDAHHLTQPHPQGEGAAAAIRAAIASAGIEPPAIDLIAAHATGTPDNDAAEHAAFAAVFGAKLAGTPMVAFKSHVGHTLGGAGAVELILSVMALRSGVIPPTANVTPPQLEFADVNLSTTSQAASIRATLNTSLGFGGANTCVILAPPAPARAAGNAKRREVFITGIGVVLDGAVGADALLERLKSPPAAVADTGNIDDANFIHLLNARRVRRMNSYVKLSLAAAALAVRDAGVAADPAFAASCPALLGTTHGGAGYCNDYYRQIVAEGLGAANPMLFAEGVPNVAAAHLSMMLGLRGACQTVIGSRTAALDALRLAFLRIATGEWDRAVIGAAEEFTPIVNAAYGHCGLYAPERAGAAFTDAGGFAVGAGAVTLLLESAESVNRRDGKVRARVAAVAGGTIRGDTAVADWTELLETVGPAQAVVSSANHTWVDRLESAALSRFAPGAAVSSMYGHFPELFSVGPLAALAATILRRKLPPLVGGGELLPTFLRATGDEPANAFVALSTGYTGTAAAARIEIESP
jgi:3-oxoacyl-[acyl-carrier-protein] synthase II